MLDALGVVAWTFGCVFAIVWIANVRATIRDVRKRADRLEANLSRASAALAPAAAHTKAPPVLSREQEAKLESLARQPLAVRTFTKPECLRALQANDYDERQALRLLHDTATWREKYKPESVTAADLPNSLPTRTWVPGGLSREGWPVLECYVARWRPNEYDFDEHNRLIGFLFTRALARNPNAERFLVLFDMEGWKLEHGSPHCMRLVLSMVSLTQVQFCERLGAAVLVNVPAIFRLAWAMIKPMIDERTSSRVFLYGSNAREWRAAIAQYVDDDNLPVLLGGKRRETPFGAGYEGSDGGGDGGSSRLRGAAGDERGPAWSLQSCIQACAQKRCV
jgi:hypothetical protein